MASPNLSDNQLRGFILQAASREFQRHGVSAVTMVDIARVAGVARATLYKYFQSKEQIAVELHASIWNGAANAVATAIGDLPMRTAEFTSVDCAVDAFFLEVQRNASVFANDDGDYVHRALHEASHEHALVGARLAAQILDAMTLRLLQRAPHVDRAALREHARVLSWIVASMARPAVSRERVLDVRMTDSVKRTVRAYIADVKKTDQAA